MSDFFAICGLLGCEKRHFGVKKLAYRTEKDHKTQAERYTFCKPKIRDFCENQRKTLINSNLTSMLIFRIFATVITRADLHAILRGVKRSACQNFSELI